jgi:hypothetical protein
MKANNKSFGNVASFKYVLGDFTKSTKSFGKEIISTLIQGMPVTTWLESIV